MKSFILKIINHINLNFHKKRKIINIEHSDIKLSFLNTNEITTYRALSFSSKEPETLNWIDNFEKKSVFYDIGANVGIYSIYAAKKNDANVIAFEPSFFNLEILFKNIDINKLNKKVVIVPLALNNINSIEKFNMSDNRHASALSSFGQTYDQYGNELNIINFYKTIGMKLDTLIEIFKIDLPDYIKIDVDGIEHLILEGSSKCLQNAKSILVEITNSFDEQINKANNILTNLNFVQQKIPNTLGVQKTENQIWIKSK